MGNFLLKNAEHPQIDQCDDKCSEQYRLKDWFRAINSKKEGHIERPDADE